MFVPTLDTHELTQRNNRSVSLYADDSESESETLDSSQQSSRAHSKEHSTQEER